MEENFENDNIKANSNQNSPTVIRPIMMDTSGHSPDQESVSVNSSTSGSEVGFSSSEDSDTDQGLDEISEGTFGFGGYERSSFNFQENYVFPAGDFKKKTV